MCLFNAFSVLPDSLAGKESGALLFTANDVSGVMGVNAVPRWVWYRDVRADGGRAGWWVACPKTRVLRGLRDFCKPLRF